MSDDNLGVKLHSTLDAEVWAEEFMKINQEDMSDVDIDTMRAWFANALMAGYDIANQKMREEKQYLKEDAPAHDCRELLRYKEAFESWFKDILNSRSNPLRSILDIDVVSNTLVKNALFEKFCEVNPTGIRIEHEPVNLVSRNES